MSDRRPSPLWWVAAFVLHRALVVALGFDGVWFWEESYRLVVAEALRGGWPIPLRELQADPYNGGSLVFAGLLAAVSPLVGLSITALKGVALAWSAAGLAAWITVADRYFGRTVAHALGLLWIAAPPVLVVFNVVALGSHSDTVTLTGLATLAMYRYAGDARPDNARLAAWMVVAGLGTWFGVFTALPVAIGVLWVLACGALPPRKWPLAAAAFAVGLSPWIARTLAVGGTLDVFARTFSPAAGRGYLATLWDLAVHGVPVALDFRDIGIPGDVKVHREWIEYPWLAVYAASFVAVALRLAARVRAQLSSLAGTAFSRARNAVAACPEFPVVALFPVFLAVLASTNQEFNDYGTVRWITFRILAPVVPAMLLTIALALARSGSAVRRIVLAAFVAAGLVGTGQLLVDGAGQRASVEADASLTGAEAMGHLIVFKHGTDPVAAAIIDALPAGLRERAWRGVGFSFAYLYGTSRAEAPIAHFVAALLAVDPAHRASAIEGARLAVGPGLPQVAALLPSARRDEVAAAIDVAEQAPVAVPDAGDQAAASGRD